MKSVSVMYFDNQEDLIKAMPKVLHKGDVVLVKGSRGTRMDRVAECLSNFSLK